MSEKRADLSVNTDEAKRAKPGPFSWVKRFIQHRNGLSASKVGYNKDQRHHNKRSTPKPSSQPQTQQSHSLRLDETTESKDRHEEELEESSVIADDPEAFKIHTQQRTAHLSNDGTNKASSKPSSITHESIATKPDNVSTLPVISMSTMSIRSSTFSENSQQSTLGTMTSDHPTLFTNASTVGIPPASIFDRRERATLQSFGIINHFYANTNSSNYTFNTVMSPNSNLADVGE